MHWQSGAVCDGPRAGLFFDPDGETELERRLREGKAKIICASCPVQMQCLDYALEHHVRCGVWGGLNERERFDEQRDRARRAGAARR